MATYTEDDVQNALKDHENGAVTAAAATKHGVPRSTLRDRLGGAQSHQHTHNGEQRLLAVQEERLEH